MKNYQQEGDNVTVIAPYALASGAGCLVGAIFGIAVNAAASGAEAQLKREGVFTHAKASAEAWTVGAKVYWDNTNKVLTTTATNNTLVGAACAVAANPSPIGTVLLDGVIR